VFWQDPVMTAPMVWLVVGLVLVAAELASGEFVLLMLGGGALVAAGASLVLGTVGSALVFALASVLLLLGLRPALRRRLDRSVPHTPTRTEALVGGTATVLTRVDGHGGRVRIGDDDWSARSFDGAQVIEPGEQVTVVRIAGATALVLAHHHSAG
jgi:membrane protein implicated in regulation of membrane protease activity